ncbi:WW domain-binding protein 4-like, partial [Argonauta hians]
CASIASGGIMADYWKSQPRKFCEFCKCWLTDNKPSIEFHEKGKRHQENVQKRIDTIKKKSLSESKKKKEMENDMDNLNKAALEAFKKDIMNDPSLAKQYGITIGKKESALDSAADSKIPVKEEAIESNADNKNDDDDDDDDADVKKEEYEIEAKQTDWYEAVSEEGYHYFWNTTTNESVWEKPECYYSLQEQGLNEDGMEIKTETITENNEETDSKQETKESVDEETVKQEPEEQEQEVKTEAPSPPPSPQAKITSSRSAYGQWTTCVKTESIDYELPSVPSEMPLPTFSSEEPVKMKFKEKTLTLPDIPNGETVTFKKRKISKGSRNIRSKIEDD